MVVAQAALTGGGSEEVDLSEAGVLRDKELAANSEELLDFHHLAMVLK